MMRTAVVLLLTTPMAISSAMMALMVSAGVSPGTATMSSPTEHTAVIASSFSSESAPTSTASTIPWSSDTGMNAPESPPTDDDAITPPFFTASVISASGAGDERVVLGDVGEHHQLRAADAAAVGGALRRVLDHAPHDRDRVHVDAGARGGHLHRRAHPLGGGERLGDRVEQHRVAGGDPL